MPVKARNLILTKSQAACLIALRHCKDSKSKIAIEAEAWSHQDCNRARRTGAAGIGETKPSEKVARNCPWENLPLRDRSGSSATQSCIARRGRPACACIVTSTDAGERDRRKTRGH